MWLDKFLWAIQDSPVGLGIFIFNGKKNILWVEKLDRGERGKT